MTLVEFSCGCVGFLARDGKRPLIVNRCDKDMGDDFEMFSWSDNEDFSDKTWEPVNEEDRGAIIRRLRRHENEASRYRAIKVALRAIKVALSCNKPH
jgi:hypothetical protein